MKRNGQLTVCDKLILSSFNLEINGKRKFSAEDLVVAAWKEFPDTFGLSGYRTDSGKLSYPDSNRVFAEIMGSKPIRKAGFLRKVGTKIYELTEAGRNRADLLLKNVHEKSIEKACLPREIESQLKLLFSSKAVDKFKNNRSNDITFYDACAFWGISPRSSSIEFEGRVANLKKIIQSTLDATKEDSLTFDHGSYAFGSVDLQNLLELHDYLLKRFNDEINVIKKRKTERRK